jgi:hypothetical protein
MDRGTLNVSYDVVGDILAIDLVPRHAEQEFDFIDDFVVGRFNSGTGKVEGFELLFFRKEAERGGSVIELPLDAVLEPEPVPGS